MLLKIETDNCNNGRLEIAASKKKQQRQNKWFTTTNNFHRKYKWAVGRSNASTGFSEISWIKLNNGRINAPIKKCNFPNTATFNTKSRTTRQRSTWCRLKMTESMEFWSPGWGILRTGRVNIWKLRLLWAIIPKSRGRKKNSKTNSIIKLKIMKNFNSY